MLREPIILDMIWTRSICNLLKELGTSRVRIPSLHHTVWSLSSVSAGQSHFMNNSGSCASSIGVFSPKPQHFPLFLPVEGKPFFRRSSKLTITVNIKNIVKASNQTVGRLDFSDRATITSLLEPIRQPCSAATFLLKER